MPFHAPVADQRFLLDTVVRIGELEGDGFPSLSADIVDAILEGAAQFAEGEFAPLNRIGDTEGSRWTPEGVKMPKGYHEAYQAYVEGGWGTIHGPEAQGGQGLPFTLATAVFEDLCAANMGFSLIMMLTPGAVESLVAHGSAEQQETWLPKLISGEWNGTMCLTEPHAGSDVGALRTQRGAGRATAASGSRAPRSTSPMASTTSTDNIDPPRARAHARQRRRARKRHLALPGAEILRQRRRLDWATATTRAAVSLEHKLGIHVSPTCGDVLWRQWRRWAGWSARKMKGCAAMFTMMNHARL
jgi:hypothetical protein